MHNLCIHRRSAHGLLALLILTAGCERANPSRPSSLESLVNIPAEVAFCADEVNRYRASIGRGRLERSPDLEAFAARAAEVDTIARQPHHHFKTTGGGGTSAAETQILWWRGYTVRSVIRRGLEEMWHAGAATPHYAVLAGPYTQVGCGIFLNGTEVSVSQDFR
jgi:hypothetical protein